LRPSAPPPGPELVRTAPVIVVAPGRRRAPTAGSAGQRPGVPRGRQQPVPHQYRAAAPPARYRPGPDARPASKDSRNHFQAHADGQD
jgi:hypothetical protein